MKSLKEQLEKYTGILNKRVHGDFDIEEYLQFVEEYNDLLEQELKAEREKLRQQGNKDNWEGIKGQRMFGRIEQINELIGDDIK